MLGFHKVFTLISWIGATVVLGAPDTASLREKIQQWTVQADGKVAAACALPGTLLDCDLNADYKSPMQSVFKFPLALTVFHEIERGNLSLDQSIRFKTEDRILPQTNSRLQEEHPNANVDVSVEQLLRLSTSFSDNVAADMLLRAIGGPKAVMDYVTSLGIAGFHLEDDEHALHRDPSLQYRNWFTPNGAVALLRLVSDHPPLSPEHLGMLMEWMQSSVKPRLGAALPANTKVAHKAGTSDVVNGIAAATNDIGLITLPDGRRLAIAVFITDSRATETAREGIISQIAKDTYQAALKAGSHTAAAGSGGTALRLEDFARESLRAAKAAGLIHVRDIKSDRVLVHVGGSADGSLMTDLSASSLVAPLSVIKIYLAAIWLEHGFGDTVVECAPSGNRPLRWMRVEEVLASGCDSAGAEMAVILRRKLGGDSVLRDLCRYGLRSITLKSNASNREFGQVLSLGEKEVP